LHFFSSWIFPPHLPSSCVVSRSHFSFFPFP
jgi:hypothetical protein